MITDHSRIPALDAIRGVAILMVVATHSLSATVSVTGSYAIPTPLFRLFDYGQFGVQLFFLLSGWLMFSLYTGPRPFSNKVYWSRRWARIWPLWIVFVIATFVFLGNPNPDGSLFGSLILTIFFLGWLTPLLVAVPTGGITIQQEMGHYTLFALFRKRSAAFLALTVILGYLSQWTAEYVLTQTDPESFVGVAMSAWLRLNLFNTWPFFLLGGLALALYRRWRTEGFTALFPDSVKTPLLVFVAIGLFSLSTYSQETPGYFVLGYVLFGVLVALTLNALPATGSMIRSIGRYSYFMYFFHFWVLRWIESAYRANDFPGNDQTSVIYNITALVAIWFLATAISWSCGWISWRIFEKPIMRFTQQRVR